MQNAYKLDDEILTTAECANVAKLHKTTIYLAIKSGELKAFDVCPGGRKKFRVMKSDLISWITAAPTETIGRAA